ncbi:MAG: hypothetical protein EOP11_05915 [Proteobacteria bacterium]|nr:MAG: hypothetical protein EOP11_05915 [Pseudomonadota bacterium]
MSFAKNRKPFENAFTSSVPAKKLGASSPVREATDRQTSLRQVKMEAEQLKEKLQASILDNPKLAKKAAVLISLWVDGKNKKR